MIFGPTTEVRLQLPRIAAGDDYVQIDNCVGSAWRKALASSRPQRARTTLIVFLLPPE